MHVKYLLFPVFLLTGCATGGQAEDPRKTAAFRQIVTQMVYPDCPPPIGYESAQCGSTSDEFTDKSRLAAFKRVYCTGKSKAQCARTIQETFDARLKLKYSRAEASDWERVNLECKADRTKCDPKTKEISISSSHNSNLMKDYWARSETIDNADREERARVYSIMSRNLSEQQQRQKESNDAYLRTLQNNQPTRTNCTTRWIGGIAHQDCTTR